VLESLIALPRPPNSVMTKVSNSPRHKEAPAPATRAAARVAPRLETADRRLRVSERLTSGLSIAHIARVEQLAVPRTRQVIAEMLASHERDPKSRPEIAPQGLEKIESRLENCSGSEASNLQDLVLENEPINGHARCERDRSSGSQ
jgi:hypothetical protein